MIDGIIKKEGEIIIGNAIICDVALSYNITKTVYCNGYYATSNDNIIFTCEKCNYKAVNSKRVFVRKDRLLCQSCTSKVTFFDKYGSESPNRLAVIKSKQHKRHSINSYIDGPARQKKTKSQSELHELRSRNTKNKWLNGDYESSRHKLSECSKKRWKNPEFRHKMLTLFSTEEYKRKLSDISKKRWQNTSYKYKMSKIGTRISKFQKAIFETLSDDWVMEYTIDNTSYTVDLFNGKTNEIIECFGDYWHCNPSYYSDSYFHKRIKKTAKEIWDHDSQRLDQLRSLGYNVKVIWESEWNNAKCG